MLKAKEWLKLKDPLFIPIIKLGNSRASTAQRMSDSKLFYISKYYSLQSGEQASIVRFLDDDRNVRVVIRATRKIKTVLISEINEIVYA